MRILHSSRLIFVSKPRCGSTSVRRLLSRHMREGDVAADLPDHERGLHPHMTAPAIHRWLAERGIDPAGYFTFTITRHPVEMLWSYWKYFAPDAESRYTYSPRYDPSRRLPFLDWLETGRVGLGSFWAATVPPSVTPRDLTPLSLEAHVCDAEGATQADAVYRIEDPVPIEIMLRDRLGGTIALPAVNHGPDAALPEIPAPLLERVVRQFPRESAMYRLTLR